MTGQCELLGSQHPQFIFVVLLFSKRYLQILVGSASLIAFLQPPLQFDSDFKNPCWRENDTLHCLPYFFVIGVMKAGTSQLWKYIAHHPDFAGTPKEPNWFAKLRFSEYLLLLLFHHVFLFLFYISQYFIGQIARMSKFSQ